MHPTRRLRLAFAVAGLVLAPAIALAQPAPQTDKLDASQLQKLGVDLFTAGNYLGALAVFKDAYTRFQSPKILLNIGITLSKLDRKAEAANAYQRYLDAPDADASQRPGITKALAELDAKIGVLEITVTPADAEVQVNDDDWTTADKVKLYRVPGGTFNVRAKKDRFQPETKTAQIRAGEKAAVPITLAALPDDKKVEIVQVPVDRPITIASPEIPRSRLGAFSVAHIDVVHKGAAGLVGLTFDVTPMLQIHGAGIVGPSFGGYAGASLAFLSGKIRPTVSAGMPIFMSDGARYSLRGAGGLELQINRHLAVVAEVGAEYVLNPETDIKDTVIFIPAVGASARL